MGTVTHVHNHKVYFIGASGTGKTTLAKALSARLGIVHFDSDDYFHYPTDPPYQKERSPEDRAQLLSRDLNQHRSWVLSGGAGTWVPAVEFKPTLVVFLYLPPDIRLKRIIDRERLLYGARISTGGDMETSHTEFMTWTAGYDDGTAAGTNTLPLHEAYISTVPSLLRIQKPMTTEEQLNLVLRALGI